MTRYDDELIEHYKSMIRGFTDRKCIETFRFHGLSLAEMDRGELLGVICFLAKNPMAGMREVKTVDYKDVDKK